MQGCRYVVDLRARSSRIAFGIYLSLLFLLAGVVAIAIHESGHVGAHWAIGDMICGIYISPFVGQILALYPAEPCPAQGWECLAGIIVTQAVAYAMAAVMLRRAMPLRLGVNTFLVACVTNLLMDAVYLVAGSLLSFGDPREAAMNFGISQYWFATLGFLLFLVNARILRVLWQRYFSWHCPQRTRQEHGTVLRVALAAFSLACAAYWGLCLVERAWRATAAQTG